MDETDPYKLSPLPVELTDLIGEPQVVEKVYKGLSHHFSTPRWEVWPTATDANTCRIG